MQLPLLVAMRVSSKSEGEKPRSSADGGNSKEGKPPALNSKNMQVACSSIRIQGCWQACNASLCKNSKDAGHLPIPEAQS